MQESAKGSGAAKTLESLGLALFYFREVSSPFESMAQEGVAFCIVKKVSPYSNCVFEKLVRYFELLVRNWDAIFGAACLVELQKQLHTMKDHEVLFVQSFNRLFEKLTCSFPKFGVVRAHVKPCLCDHMTIELIARMPQGPKHSSEKVAVYSHCVGVDSTCFYKWANIRSDVSHC